MIKKKKIKKSNRNKKSLVSNENVFFPYFFVSNEFVKNKFSRENVIRVLLRIYLQRNRRGFLLYIFN